MMMMIMMTMTMVSIIVRRAMVAQDKDGRGPSYRVSDNKK